ncbi:MAG TPA: LysM peptidoglycan-binding domain-containing protein [Gammaproteobacteria bacterium]
MTRKAVRDSLRPALLVLMMAAASGCGQPTTVRHYTTQLFTRSPEPVLAPRDRTALPDDRLVTDFTEPDPLSIPSGDAEYAHAIERMEAGFQFPEMRHARLDRQIAWYQRNSNTLRRSLDRADPFIAWILDQLEAKNLPTELALIPVIESGYQPLAMSPNHAAGLWQFMPATGNRFGLEQNRWYDGRRDVVDSTQAALEYLTYLRDEFDGDWLLALAAYNAGEGTVARAVRRNRAQGKPADLLSLDLPAHTQEYVLKLLALRDIVAAPGHYGIALPELDATTQIALIETSSRIELDKAADMAGISVADMQKLNPGLRRTTTPPQGPHRLVLPLDTADRFAAHLADMTVSDDTDKPQDIQSLASSTSSGRNNDPDTATHRVRPGETLWGIARRYGIPVDQLAKRNEMDSGEPLRAGQVLQVKGGARRKDEDRSTTTTMVDTGKDSPAAVASRQTLQYTVRRGDSLIQISRRYRVAVSDLRKWNGLGVDQYLQPGQKLTLYPDTTLRADGRGG